MPTYVCRCVKCDKTIEYLSTVDERNNMPECCGPTERVLTIPRVIMDIQPYQTAAADKETGKQVFIKSRSEHKAFLRRNNYEEVGNDPLPEHITNPEAHADRHKNTPVDNSSHLINSIDVLSAT